MRFMGKEDIVVYFDYEIWLLIQHLEGNGSNWSEILFQFINLIISISVIPLESFREF